MINSGIVRLTGKEFVQMRSFITGSIAMIAMVFTLAGAAHAQQSATLGPVTNLPLPRFVSLKGSNANVRRGPSQSHRIDWILTRKGTPLLVTAEFEHWRRVQDEDGAGGWIHYALLSGRRTAVVRAQRAPLHNEPTETSPTVALVERGVLGALGACNPQWCKIEVQNVAGWIRKSEIWGVSAAEIRE